MGNAVLGYDPRSLGAVLTAVTLWGVSFPVLRVALGYFPPVTLALLRYALASLPILAYLGLRFGLRGSLRELRADFPLLLALALFSVALPQVTQNLGLVRNESSALTAILQASAPAFTVLLAFLVLHESVGWKKVLGLLLAILASLLLAADELTFRGTTFQGNLLVLASSLSYGVAGIFAKDLLSRRHPGLVVGWSFVLGTLLIVPALPLDAGLPLDPAPPGWGLVLFLALLPGFLASFLFYVVLRQQDLSRLVFFVYLIPLLAAVPAVLLLGETVTLRMAALGVLIIVGVAIAQGEVPAGRVGVPRG